MPFNVIMSYSFFFSWRLGFIVLIRPGWVFKEGRTVKKKIVVFSPKIKVI